jgi:hypothetical protein
VILQSAEFTANVIVCYIATIDKRLLLMLVVTSDK